MNTFSFRAECQADVDSFLQKSQVSGIKLTVTTNGFPDVEIEFESEATLEDLIEVIRKVRDGHVVYQTLRQVPLSENSLKRDYWF